MGNIIQLLPENVANQIAAGEVIQRPASAVKELLENAVDANATKIDLVIKDAGKSLIQVIDNGYGMSKDDAVFCFNRHATSKITTAEDLFSVNTKGFRGEALASIAAIAHVELKTKRSEDELGTHIIMKGSEIESQESISSSVGTNIMMKNLFYNVPARRNFLKSNAVETKHIIDEFERVALAHCDIHFTMHHNDHLVFDLPKGTTRQRIVNILGKKYNERLVPLEEKTSITEISGYIVKPEFSKKTRGEQFFFVNGRYIKNSYLNHAVTNAFKELISKDQFPSYIIYLEVPKDTIDINIHPTKTEIKFQNDRSIYAIVHSTVKNSLGKYSISPSLDFNQETSFNVAPLKKGETITPPSIKINPNYNPFQSNPSENKSEDIQSSINMLNETQDAFNQSNISITKNIEDPIVEQNWSGLLNTEKSIKYFQYQQKIIVTHIKSGILLIDQHRAHQQVLYERFLQNIQTKRSQIQKLLFPLHIELSVSDYELSLELLDDMNNLGLEIDDFGNNTLVINGIPDDINEEECSGLIENCLENFKNHAEHFKNTTEKLAWSFSKSGAIKAGRSLNKIEMEHLIDQLFACDSPYFNSKGNVIISKIDMEEINKRFEKR